MHVFASPIELKHTRKFTVATEAAPNISGMKTVSKSIDKLTSKPGAAARRGATRHDEIMSIERRAWCDVMSIWRHVHGSLKCAMKVALGGYDKTDGTILLHDSLISAIQFDIFLARNAQYVTEHRKCFGPTILQLGLLSPSIPRYAVERALNHVRIAISN